MINQLENEIEQARKDIFSDGYEMSFGEVINLYKEKELIINPEFQRLFRWDITQKTRFIESLLLGIPIPPIFVFQNEKGIWELIDGLQRVSTILEFSGMLRNSDDENNLKEPSTLEGTPYLPSLQGKRWESSTENAEDGIGKSLQLQIKRARIRVEILKKESDGNAKYELFQRLNTGGSPLSEQEIRNCVAVMINGKYYEWLKNCSEYESFIFTTNQTESAIEKQSSIELVLRFFAFRNCTYSNGSDVHQYLDISNMQMATDKKIKFKEEEEIFKKTFDLVKKALGEDAFKKWDGSRFKGRFLISVFEIIANGISKNIDSIEKMKEDKKIEFIRNKSIEIWSNQTFKSYSGQGISGSTRLSKLLPIAEGFMKP